MRYPCKLQKGDNIGICAPSSGLPQSQYARLENSKNNLMELGYHCVESPSLRNNGKCVSADAQTRAAEFMDMYENPHIKAIIPPWGGEFLMDMLPFLNFEKIMTLSPKWVCGYSDITTLTFALTLNCDMATIHGSNIMNMGFSHIHKTDLMTFEAMSKEEITNTAQSVGVDLQVGMIYPQSHIPSPMKVCGNLLTEEINIRLKDG